MPWSGSAFSGMNFQRTCAIDLNCFSHGRARMMGQVAINAITHRRASVHLRRQSAVVLHRPSPQPYGCARPGPGPPEGCPAAISATPSACQATFPAPWSRCPVAPTTRCSGCAPALSSPTSTASSASFWSRPIYHARDLHSTGTARVVALHQSIPGGIAHARSARLGPQCRPKCGSSPCDAPHRLPPLPDSLVMPSGTTAG